MKIMVRIVKSSIRRSLPCLMSAILVSAALFLFEGIKEMFLGTMSEAERLRSSLGISAHLYIYVLLFIGIILILYTVNNYSRIRLRDYGTLLVLGSEKGAVIRMMLAEYGMISAVSYAAGCICGTIFLFAVRAVILSEGIHMGLNGRMYLSVVLKTLFYMLVVYGAAVFMNAVYLQGSSLAALMSYDRKKSRLPSVKASMAGTLCGIVCFAAAAVILAKEHIPPYIKMKYGLLLALAGLFLCFTYMGRLILMLLNCREGWYYRHLLKIKDLYYRFADNKNMMLLGFVINFAVLIFINKNIVEFGSTDSRYLWKYPYDYVYAVEEGKEEALLREIGADQADAGAGGSAEVYPCLFLTSTEGGDYLGMPVSAFNRLAGEEEKVEPGKVISVLQKQDTDEDILLPSGQAALEGSGGIQRFEAGKQMSRILFAAQQPESIGVLVFADPDYDSLRERWGGMSLITQRTGAAGRIQGKGEESGKQMRKIARSAGARLFYSRAELMLRDRKEDIMSLIFYLCMGIFLLISNMAVLAVRMWTEIPVLSGKYGFLRKLGMDDGDIKSKVKGELSVCMTFPFVLSSVMGIGALIGLFGGGGYSLDLRIIAVFAALVFVQGGMIAGIKNYGYRLVKDRIEEGNGVMVWN